MGDNARNVGNDVYDMFCACARETPHACVTGTEKTLYPINIRILDKIIRRYDIPGKVFLIVDIISQR
jgi:hypothetical protein